MNLSVILGNLGNTCDRFLSSGYKEQLPKEEMIRQAAEIEGVTGIELVGSWDVTRENVQEMKALLRQNHLRCVSIIPDHFAQKRWGKGAFTSRDPEIRRQAVELTKEMIDCAVILECPLINLWPGQDGYDYAFQGEFDKAPLYLIEAIRECADYNKEIRISLEYKAKEPRTHSYMARASDTLLLALETGRENVGVTIDTGHSFAAGENAAEAAAMLLRHQKLFHMHFNDNYRSWDDDMIVGSVHLVEYIELLYWLKALNYSGYYSMDQYPYREDGKAAIAASVAYVAGLSAKVDKFGLETFRRIISSGSPTEMHAMVRRLLGF